MNKELEAEVKGIQSCIMGAAERFPLPKRFTSTDNPDGTPSMIVTDTVTGKSSRVSLFAYGEVRETLTDLFPDSC